MVARQKIDSNETGLSYAEEVNLGVLDANPANVNWFPLEPNEYDDFGGELTLLARRPINASRQRKKGSVTDLDASGGFNQDFTQTNTQNLMQGFMFASFRNKATQAVTAVLADGFSVFSEVGFAVGDLVLASGSGIVGNNGVKPVTAVAAGKLSAAGLTVEASPPTGTKVVKIGVASAIGDIDVALVGGVYQFTSTTLDFTTLGIIPGEWIYVGGDGATSSFATAGNNGFKRVKKVTAHTMLIDESVAVMAVEANTTKLVEIYIARVLKNELDDLIVRRSYHLERRLGAPDSAQPTQKQAEYVKGAVANELVLNVEQADKLNADLSFIAIDNEQVPSTTGIKAGNRVPLVESDMFNTSTDIVALRLSVYDPANPTPLPLFAYLTELKMTINNNVSPNKAVAVLGAFDVTAGTFEVSAEAEAYFNTVQAVQAVRNNANGQMFMAVVKNNYGFVMDMPLVALGNARLNVAIDEPIKLPLTLDAATAALLNPDLDYTLLWSFFDYLPNAARQKG